MALNVTTTGRQTFLLKLSNVLYQFLCKIKESPFLGIMLNEKCDISVEKKLDSYIKFIHDGKASVARLGNKHI